MAILHLREGGLRRGENFWLRLTTASMQCLRLSERFFILSALRLAQMKCSLRFL